MGGWIQCPQIAGGDIFAHSSDVVPGSTIVVGMPVTFTLGTDMKGRRRANRISADMSGCYGGCIGFGSGGGKAFSGKCGNGIPFMGFAGKCGGVQDFGGKGILKGGSNMKAGADLSAYHGQRLEGQVTSWREQWGWIASPSFAGDAEIFAHFEDCKDVFRKRECGCNSQLVVMIRADFV